MMKVLWFAPGLGATATLAAFVLVFWGCSALPRSEHATPNRNDGPARFAVLAAGGTGLSVQSRCKA
jgi:hypothetical protein